MIAWRIATDAPAYVATDLAGEGARITGGRWNSKGMALLYASSTIALTVLETVVHLSSGGLPLNRYLVRIDIPDGIWAEREEIDHENAAPGWDALPATGSALLVSHHASHVDTLIIASAASRPVHFVVGQNFFSMPVLSYLLKHSKAIPLPAANAPADAATACRNAVSAALDAGELVAVFMLSNAQAKNADQGEANTVANWVAANPVLPQPCPAPILTIVLENVQNGVFARGTLTLWQRLARLRFMRPITIRLAEGAARSDKATG